MYLCVLLVGVELQYPDGALQANGFLEALVKRAYHLPLYTSTQPLEDPLNPKELPKTLYVSSVDLDMQMVCVAFYSLLD